MTMGKLAVAVAAAVVSAGTYAPASVIYLRDNATAFNGNAVTQTTFDDTWVSGVVGGTGGTVNNGNSSNFQLRTPGNGTFDAGLLGIKDLTTTILPPTNGSGAALQINSAVLHLYANPAFPGDSNPTTSVYRMISDWMPSAAGGNEGNTSGRYRVVSTTSNWALGNSFSTSDYSTLHVAALSTWNVTTPYLNDFDVKLLVQDLYTYGNFGWALRTSGTSAQQIRTSENSASLTPVLEINYDYVPEPAALGLLGISCVGLIARRPRRVEV